jgi:DNA mismatch repair protein MutL
MADIIQLLPDSIANQIAAGEVIQRPASVVKELMENALDAGATNIQLIVKDAGRTLVQVIDNGKGMSETDARMSLERHATSKISSADDLFHLNTMGFRGEALASIASIAHLEMKTAQIEATIGTQLLVEGSKVLEQSPCAFQLGTSIAVKNLFFNVPARRKFLKSDQIELRHIIDEFERVALPNPHIKFTFHHNNNELFHLEKGGFRQRIVSVFGKRYNEKLVPVEEETDIVKISGFVGKPEAAKKTRGEQFFFVNKRFIKSTYLHHAVQESMRELIPGNAFASYFLMLEVNPEFIDVNIHPTKTEIKFEDERAIYALLRSAIRRGIGSNNVFPSLDFEQENSFNVPLKPSGEIRAPQIQINPNYNPFHESSQAPKNNGGNSHYTKETSERERNNLENWQKLYSSNPAMAEAMKPHVFAQNESVSAEQQSFAVHPETQEHKEVSKAVFQLHGKYILAQIKSGLVLIHQSRAHERILFERYLHALNEQQAWSQQQLFPQTVQLSAGDSELIREIMNELQFIGIGIHEFGKNTFVVQGMPSHIENTDAQTLLEGVVEQYKNTMQSVNLQKNEAFALALARKTAISTSKVLQQEELKQLIDELFACENPSTTASGKAIIHTFSLNELDKLFNT